MRILKMGMAAVLGAAALGAQAQGMAVIDRANIVQAIKQVDAWRQQSAQMHQQIASMTGDRGMSTLLPAAPAAMPPDWHQAMTTLSPLGQQYRAAQTVLTPAELASLPPTLKALVDQGGTLSAANQAMAQAAYDDAGARQARLHTMSGALARTTDPKAAYDLSNAIAIEHAALLQNQNQLIAAASGAVAQAQAQQQVVNQLRASAAGTGKFPKLSTSLP